MVSQFLVDGGYCGADRSSRPGSREARALQEAAYSVSWGRLGVAAVMNLLAFTGGLAVALMIAGFFWYLCRDDNANSN